MADKIIVSQQTTDLVAKFEGFSATVYLDAVKIPTVGFGHVVKPGETFKKPITEVQAKNILAQDLVTAQQSVLDLVKVKLNDNQISSLTSWVFNLGGEALAGSTLLKLLNVGNYQGAANEFDKWVHAGTPPQVLPGLVTRRAEEKALFLNGLNVNKTPSAVNSLSTPQTSADPNKYRLFCPGDDSSKFVILDSQEKRDLVETIAHNLDLPYTVDVHSGKVYLGHSKIVATPAKKDPDITYGGGLGTPDLPVPYYSQRDSQIVYQGENQALRMCFSSSCAMLVEYLRPGTLKGDNGDDQYLQKEESFSDTTDASGQLRALKVYGVDAEFRQNLTFADIDAQLNKEIPIPVGILHHGTVDAASGGGHYIIITGKTKSGDYIVNDPYGELDLVNGVYMNTVGKHLTYSKTNLGKRWMPKGNDGWGVIASTQRVHV